jgi:hypothetical protein
MAKAAKEKEEIPGAERDNQNNKKAVGRRWGQYSGSLEVVADAMVRKSSRTERSDRIETQRNKNAALRRNKAVAHDRLLRAVV